MLKSSPIVQQNNLNCNNPQMLEEMIPSLDTGPVSRGLASPSQPCPAGQSELRRCTAGLLSAIWWSFLLRSQVPSGENSHHLSVQHLTQEFGVDD